MDHMVELIITGMEGETIREFVVPLETARKRLDDVAEEGVEEFVANFERDGTAVFRPAAALENPGSKSAITLRNKRAS
jgi:hypothetical protein